MFFKRISKKKLINIKDKAYNENWGIWPTLFFEFAVNPMINSFQFITLIRT